MTKPRLLFLKSVNDEMTLKQVDYISKSPLFAGFEVRVCYALQMSEYIERGSYAVSYFRLLQILEEEVTHFRPQKLLLHTGVAFRTKPESFLQALAVIKSRYPEIEIRYERIKSNSDEMPHHPIGRIRFQDLLNNNELFGGDEESMLS
jgi:hypothetical protein